MPDSDTLEAFERACQQRYIDEGLIPVGFRASPNLDAAGAERQLRHAGVTLGPAAAEVPGFRFVELPAGWRMEPLDGSGRWTVIRDQHGRVRAECFHKSAPYDRKGHVEVVSLGDYLAECAHDGLPVVFDGRWVTPRAVRAALRSLLADHRRRVAEFPGSRSVEAHYQERIGELERLQRTLQERLPPARPRWLEVLRSPWRSPRAGG